MPTINMVNMQGEPAGSIELNDSVFGVTPHVASMHLVVRSILAAKRQGTQSTLSRGEVRGGGRKIYRQKGTGRARLQQPRVAVPPWRIICAKPRDYVINVIRKSAVWRWLAHCPPRRRRRH